MSRIIRKFNFQHLLLLLVFEYLNEFQSSGKADTNSNSNIITNSLTNDKFNMNMRP